MRGAKRLLGGLAIWLALAALVPALAAAGSISGTVTDEETDLGIAGIEVCPQPSPYTFEADCTKTDANGAYLLNELPPASYELRFSAWPLELNYVQEWYGGDQIYPGDLVTVGATEAKTGIDAELEEGGVIKGAATDAETLGPAAGVWVCIEALEPVFYGTCARADSSGEYERNDLPTGEYRISFDGENDVNYLQRFYDESDTFSGATHVPVTAGSTVSGIDAVLHPGAQIIGTVTEAGTGVPLGEIEVCLWRPGISLPPEYVERCTRTDAGGNYAIRSLPADSYDDVFSQEGGGFGGDTFGEQWWQGVSSSSEATPLTIAPPETLTGIDAQLVDFAVDGPGPGTGGGTITPPPPPTSKPQPRKCKKGFHRKLVKGKQRCVRKHKHHRHRHHKR